MPWSTGYLQQKIDEQALYRAIEVKGENCKSAMQQIKGSFSQQIAVSEEAINWTKYEGIGQGNGQIKKKQYVCGDSN